MSFAMPARLPLARTPTPLRRLDRLSERWGVDLWIKRDDLTGAALSGNKIRKLEFELAAARESGATAVITCGGLQSNHARATAVAARELGMVPHLVLRTADGKPPAEADGNLLLDLLVGAEVTWVDPAAYRERRGGIMAGIAEAMAGRGLRGYVIPEGASSARGALGYVAATREMLDQVGGAEAPARIDYLVHACGSGGTTAGLALGARLFGAPWMPVAFAVCDDEAYFRDALSAIVAEFHASFGGPRSLEELPLVLSDRYTGGGYGINTPEELAFLRDVARTEGVLLDPVYGLKAFFGMAKEIEAGRTFRKGATLCFLHTGGIFGLFPKKSEFGALAGGGDGARDAG